VAIVAPLSVTVVPLPLVAGLIVPEMLHVAAWEEAVKFTPVTLAALTVVLWPGGLKLKPFRVGVTV
jgi:hypothetical protein